MVPAEESTFDRIEKAAVGDMYFVGKGLKALMGNVYSSKLVIFPFAHEMGLQSPRELANGLPEVAARLLDGQYWTREAEGVFLKSRFFNWLRGATVDEHGDWHLLTAMSARLSSRLQVNLAVSEKVRGFPRAAIEILEVIIGLIVQLSRRESGLDLRAFVQSANQSCGIRSRGEDSTSYSSQEGSTEDSCLLEREHR